MPTLNNKIMLIQFSSVVYIQICVLTQQYKRKMTQKFEETGVQSLITSEQDQKEQSKRSWASRTFSPMREGSLRGAIFTLLASAMGTGIFNLPLRVEQIGVIAFFAFALLAGIFSVLGMKFISKLIKQKGVTSYSDMANQAGGKILMRVSQICLIVYPWGITICFQVILAKFLVQLLNDVGGLPLYDNRDDEVYSRVGNLTRIIVNLAVLLLSLPLVMKKNIGILQKLGLVSVIAVLFNVFAIIVTTFTGFSRQIDGETLTYHGIFQLEKGQVNWLTVGDLEALSLHAQGFASILFCYVNHQLFFPLSSSLKRPSEKRFSKIISRVHVTEIIVYCSLAITAYLLLVQHADKYPISAMVIVSIPTTMITIGKGTMVLALFFAVSLNMFPAREAIYETFQFQRTGPAHVIITFLLMISSCGIAIMFQKVNSYFGLLGGTAGVLMAGGIPAICFQRLKNKLTCWDIISLIIALLVTLVGFTGAILSVIDPA